MISDRDMQLFFIRALFGNFGFCQNNTQPVSSTIKPAKHFHKADGHLKGNVFVINSKVFLKYFN